MFTQDEINRLWDGEYIEIAGKRYGLCAKCLRAIRLDGPLKGIHICALEEERETNVQQVLRHRNR